MPLSPPVLLQPTRGPVHAVPSAQQTSQLDPNEVIVPARIIRILRAGWTDHIPLDAITNRACRLATFQLTRNTEHGLTMGSDGRIISKASPIDHSKEDKIDVSDWYQASRNLISAIANHLWASGDSAAGGANARRIAEIFSRHFLTLQGRTDFEESFAVYREYDINIRRRYLHQSALFSPAVFQQKLYESIARSHDLQERSSLRDLLSRASASAFTPSARPGTTSLTHKSFKFQGAFQPRSDNGWVARGSAQNPSEKGRSFLAGALADRFGNIRCMFCASSAHKYSSCPGPGRFLRKDSAGVWRDTAGKTVCINFNGPITCPRGPACPHLHTCSLCGSGSHSAQSCSL